MTIDKPLQDTTQLLDDFRAAALSQLLVAGTTRFDFGTVLAGKPMTYESLRGQLKLAERPATVLCTAFRSLGLIDVTDDRVHLTSYGQEKLDPASPFNLRGYVGLGAYSADVQNMISCLERDAPAGDVSYVFHEGAGPSALDDPETSDALTRAMAARARNVAPFVAEAIDLSNCRRLIDVGGAHGIYSLELLKRFPDLRATIIDREPPLKVADEYADAAGLRDRVELIFGDIHQYQLGEEVDAVLMANILHDYSSAHASRLVAQYSRQLGAGGRLMILDAFLHPVPHGHPPISTGPRAVAAYSAMLFSMCEGRCYRLDEYQAMMASAGLEVDAAIASVPAHGSILTGYAR
jgi:predicted O-methyltransferase YrrM